MQVASMRVLKGHGAKSRDHEIVRAHKQVSKGRPKSFSVVTDPRV